MKTCNTLILLILFMLSANVQAECNNSQTGSGEVLGTLLGAAIGGLVGSQIGGGTGNKIAIGAGVLAGGLVGNKIGSQLDCQDQAYHVDTTQNALEYQPTGQPSSWKNPDSGHSGTVTPTKTYTVNDGTPCREFTQIINVDGQAEEVRATACRQEDGTWQMMDT